MSRLGNPLVNELLIGIGAKDHLEHAAADGRRHRVPELLRPAAAAQAAADPVPGRVSQPGRVQRRSSNTRPDIEAIFLTGIPAGVITQAPTFTNYNGTGVKADMLRLNTAIPPSSSPNSLGLLGLDVAGFPNGRRVFDDVATIALRACRGDARLRRPSFTADAAAGEVDFGLTTEYGHRSDGQGHRGLSADLPVPGTPYSGYRTRPRRPSRWLRSHGPPPGTSEVGSVVLDIGGDIGAADRACAGDSGRARDRDPPPRAPRGTARTSRSGRGVSRRRGVRRPLPGLGPRDYEVRVRGDAEGPPGRSRGRRVSEARLGA